MASARLRKLAGTVFSEYYLARRQSAALISRRAFANKSSSLANKESGKDLDVPLKYSGSEAQAWRAKQTRSGRDISSDQVLWYQQYVVMGSLAVFMIYFCILREESDIDRKFDLTLYDHIEGLEERQIEEALAFNRRNGIPTKALEERLKEIRGL